MSITFSSDVKGNITNKSEPCLCAQMAETWSDFYHGEDTPAIRAALKAEANPQCPLCKGTGIEKVSHEDSPHMNLANANAEILFKVLNIPFDSIGELTIPEARRALIKAMSRSSVKEFERPDHIEYGKPREVEPGVVDLKPLRVFGPGVNEEKIHEYIKRFGEFISEVIQKGGTKIYWS
jgi:hypothetical protein